jgi:hypothetical protein
LQIIISVGKTCQRYNNYCEDFAKVFHGKIFTKDLSILVKLINFYVTF